MGNLKFNKMNKKKFLGIILIIIIFFSGFIIGRVTKKEQQSKIFLLPPVNCNLETPHLKF